MIVADPVWRQIAAIRWRRNDGSEVWEGDEFHSNPLNPRCLMWEGAGPDPGSYLIKARRRDRRERFTVRRRFGSAETAMRAADDAYPIVPESK